MSQRPTWITDFATLENDKTYITCAISAYGKLVSHPEILIGWQAKRLLKNCYVAIPLPEFKEKP